MTVQDDVMAQGVILTEVAATKVTNLLAQEDRDDLRLRMRFSQGYSLRYQLHFDEREVEGDIVRPSTAFR